MPTYCEMDVCEHGDVSRTHWVPLQPFAHQVGGHVSMLRFDDCTICKPLVPREHSFYTSMPRLLVEFTPQYRGVIKVAWHDNGLGELSPVVCRSNVLEDNVATDLEFASSRQFADDGLLMSDSDEERPRRPSRIISRSRRNSRERTRTDDGTPGESLEECHSAKRGSHSHKLQWPLSTGVPDCQFILLENLAYNFRLPCVLDLKMGTRQHGDDASEAKRVGHTKKCADTTSSTLGLRICGMQAYKVTTEEYVCHSKYHGRRLDCDGVLRCLRSFLHDGRRLLVELFVPLLERLQRLVKVIERLDSYRFYSSSLLIMYDGAEGECRRDMHDKGLSSRSVAVCMIDFAHATHAGFLGDDIVHVGPDRGYLFGLENLIRLIEEILEEDAVSSAT